MFEQLTVTAIPDKLKFMENDSIRIKYMIKLFVQIISVNLSIKFIYSYSSTLESNFILQHIILKLFMRLSGKIMILLGTPTRRVYFIILPSFFLVVHFKKFIHINKL